MNKKDSFMEDSPYSNQVQVCELSYVYIYMIYDIILSSDMMVIFVCGFMAGWLNGGWVDGWIERSMDQWIDTGR